MNNRTTILVTGGAGFIGGNLVRHLISLDRYKVVNLDLLTYAGHLETLNGVFESPDHVFVHGDIGDKELVRATLRAHQPTFIVNCAAETHVDRSIDGPSAFVQTNVAATCRFLEVVAEFWRSLDQQARDRFRFLHVSTDEVYGSLGDTGYFTEETPYAPNSPYSASKAASDYFVRAFHHTYGLPAITTNCSNNYGPYQYPEKLMPLMIMAALAGKALPVYGDGKNVRDWLFVEDHCHGLLEVLMRGQIGEKYNIGGNSERSNIDVVRGICHILDELVPGSPHRPHQRLISFVSDRPGHDRRYAIDASKIRQSLGWSPSVTFDQGLRRTVEWYLANPGWCEKVAQGEKAGERRGLVVDGGGVG